MKRILLTTAIIIMLIIGLFALTGCGKGEEGEKSGDKKEEYTKEVDTYTLERSDGSKLEFSIAKDLGFTGTASDNNIKMDGNEGSHLNIYFVYDYKNSSNIWKGADAFYNKYFGYEEKELGGFKAYTIYRGNEEEDSESPFGVEGALILTDPDSNNKVYGVNFEITRNGTDTDKKFNPKEMFENPDFQHIFETLKVTPATPEEPAPEPAE